MIHQVAASISNAAFAKLLLFMGTNSIVAYYSICHFVFIELLCKAPSRYATVAMQQVNCVVAIRTGL